MTQEDCYDYYHDYEDICSTGCCLNCEDSEDGCLCYFCKCKQCYWYIPPKEWNLEKGKCGLVLKWGKEND